MSNLLGFQSQVVTDAYRSMVRATWPSTLKVIYPGGLDAGLLREWRQRRPDGLLVFRHYFPDENLDPAKWFTTIAAADQIADLHPILEVPINESYQTSEEAVRMLAGYSADFVRLAADNGYKAAVGVFSEGNPSLTDWGVFNPALKAARDHGGYLALHEYGIPSLGMEDWHLLRHRRVWAMLPDDAKVPIIVTEAGIDGGIEGRREVGWRGYYDAAAYAGWLRTYHREIAADPYVHGATLFLCGGYPQWASFDITDEVDLRPPLTENLSMPARWTPQEPTVADLRGLDCSNHQGVIDWVHVAASGVAFAFIKASGDETSSNVYLDPEFPTNWAQARAVGLVRGAYHYARPSRVSPAASVTTLQRAIQAVGGLAAGDLIALDTEDPDVPDRTSLHVWTAEWLALAEQVFGVAPVKYSARYYTSTHDLEHADLERFPTWWAAYQATEPAGVPGWAPIRIWQHSASGTVPGVSGQVDLNVFHGTAAELRALGLPAPAHVDWETPVFAPIYQGASAVGGMPDRVAQDEEDAADIIRLMDAMKSRHPVT